jgi:predicted metal-binding membrane protein
VIRLASRRIGRLEQSRAASSLRETFDAHPAWWVAAIGLVSWVPIVQHGVARWGHALHHRADITAALLDWQLMVLAMMFPIIVYQAGGVAARSFPERRHYAVAQFLVGYLVPWTAFGIVANALVTPTWAWWPWVTVVTCLAAATWALLPVRERAMMMVHGYTAILAPEGWPAMRDSVTSGLVVGGYCVLGCWPLMLACVFSGHNLVVVGAGAVISVAESRSFRPPRRTVVLVTLSLAALLALFP